MKIDAEGFDYAVLQGLAETIARARPFVILEIAWSEDDEIVRFFAERDYVVLGYDVASDRFHEDAKALYSATLGPPQLVCRAARENCGPSGGRHRAVNGRIRPRASRKCAPSVRPSG